MTEERPRPDFNRYPLLWLAVAFSIGIFTANFISFTETVLLVSLIATTLMAVILRKDEAATFLILFAFLAAGALSFQCEVKRNTQPDRLKALYDNGSIRSGDPVEIEGVLLGRPEPSIDGVFLNLRSEDLKYRGEERHVSGRVRLFLPINEQNENNLDLKYGSRVRIACRIEREDEYLNPGVIPKREMLDRIGIDGTGSIKSPLLVEKLADERVFLPLAWVYDQRAQLINDFKNNLGTPTGGVMIASLLGDKYFLDKDTADLFRDGGTFHILVISGLHVTFIGGLLLLFLRQITRNRWVQFAVTMLALWAYTLAVGADVPVVRAAIMFTTVLFSYAIYRQGSLLNSLGICSLVLLVWRPSDLFNPSFQLTFVSVAAIIGFAYPLVDKLQKIGGWTPTTRTPFPSNVPDVLKRFCEMLYWKADGWKIESKRQIWTANLFKSPFLQKKIVGSFQKLTRYVFEALLVSIIVQLCMLPLSIVYFHRVSLGSVLLNLWVGFFIAIESFAAVLGAVFVHVNDLLARPFFRIAEVTNWLMLSVPRLFSDNGWASFRLPAYMGDGRIIYVLYFFPIIFFAFVINRWKPFELKKTTAWTQYKGAICAATLASILFIGTVVFHPFSVSAPDGRLHIDFLDVGQGDSALVTFPNGKTLLVDGGGSVSYKKNGDENNEPFTSDRSGIGEMVVSAFLWHRGLSHIDHILATHADADHIQGLTDVAKNFSIGSAIFGRTPMSDPDFAALAEVLSKRSIPIETVMRGDRFDIGGTTVEVLYPIPADDPEAVSDNNHSVVLRIVYGSQAFMLTGDIEKQAEAAIIANGGNVSGDLIKVAHHGSRTSSTQEFINAVGAQYAVISVGRSSPFEHPHPEVVDRWKASGATVFTTGERGTISVSTDGRDLAITTFEP